MNAIGPLFLDDLPRIGATLRLLRHRSGLTSCEVGAAIGRTGRTVRRLEEAAADRAGQLRLLAAGFAALGYRVRIELVPDGQACPDPLFDRDAGVLARMLRVHGPMTVAQMAQRAPIEAAVIDSTLRRMSVLGRARRGRDGAWVGVEGEVAVVA